MRSSSYEKSARAGAMAGGEVGSAISVLEDLVGRNGSRTVRTRARSGRVVSAAARRRMAAAQRARWAKVRTQSQTNGGGKSSGTVTAKRTLSAAACLKIAAAQVVMSACLH